MTNGYRALTAFFFVTVVSMHGHIATAANYRDVAELLRTGSFQTAHSQLLTLATKDNAEAQFQLGLMAHLGRGIPQNFLEAQKWYERAAKAGEVQSQNNLGVIYRDGLGIPVDAVVAYKWFSLAASQRNVQAIANLRVLRQGLNKADILRGQRLAQQYHDEVKTPRVAAALAPTDATPIPAQAKVPAPKQLAAEAMPQRQENSLSILAVLKAMIAPASADIPKLAETKLELTDAKSILAKKKLDLVELKTSLTENKPEPVEMKPLLAEKKTEPVTMKAELAEKKPEPVAELKARGNYLIQLGLFRNSNNVDRIHAKLKVRGIKVTAQQVNLGGRSYKRLQVGPYVNKGEAKAMAGLVNNILGIRSLMLFTGTGKQAVAVDQKMDNL
jgi:cell division septation protein DedD